MMLAATPERSTESGWKAVRANKELPMSDAETPPRLIKTDRLKTPGLSYGDESWVAVRRRLS